MALADENRCDSGAPDFFDGGENAQFVVDEHVMVGRVATLDIFELLFFVNVNHGPPFDSFQQAGAFDFAWLEDDVAIGK